MNCSFSGRSRHGAILVAVLIVAILAGFFSLHLAQSIVREYRLTQLHRDLAQCQLLADAGLDRALAMVATDGKYRGETWSIAADELSVGQSGSVQIEVQHQGTPMEIKSISVVARYPVDSPRSITAKRSWPRPVETHSALQP